MRLSVVTPAAKLALDWDTEVKSHLRLDTDDERARVEGVLIPAVVQWAETYTGRALITQTLDVFFDHWPWDGVIHLPKPPLQSVTFIQYYDNRQVVQTWAASNYILDAPAGPHARPARIRPILGTYYPPTLSPMNAVQIRYVCGYGTTHDTVPGLLRAAMLLELARLFENRESDKGSDGMTDSERVAAPFRIQRFDA